MSNNTNPAPRKKVSSAARKRRIRRKMVKSFLTGLTAGIVVSSVAAFVISVISNGSNSADPATETIVLQPAATVVVATPVPTAVPVNATPVPTAVPTAEPAVQTAEPVQQQENYGSYQVLSGIPQTDHSIGLPMSEQVPDDYFNDSVFIGDSVSLKLQYFVQKNRQNAGLSTLLGNAQFLCAGSMGSGNAMEPVSDSSIHPSFRGQKTALEDAVAAMGVKKVFIMLGMNDIAVYGPEQSAQNMMQLISRIKAKSPDVQIFVQSATPKMNSNPNHKLNNNTLFEYDLKLYELCKSMESQGVYYLDVAYIMRDGEGNLPANYCSDPEDQALHFTDEACTRWVQYLYTHALT